MNNLTKKDVEHIAHLANLELRAGELKRYRDMLSGVLGYVENLNEISTDAVDGVSHVSGLENVLREDRVLPSLSQKDALLNAKGKKDGYFKVSLVLNHE